MMEPQEAGQVVLLLNSVVKKKKTAHVLIYLFCLGFSVGV